VQTSSTLDILLVDDDRPLREMLTRSFEREGHRVTAVADGQAALDAAHDRPFDVVLLDVALGAGPTGHDVARMLRGRRDVVPIIMLTALDSEADAVQGLEAGADDYVTKPFQPKELAARIRALLRRARGMEAPSTVIRLGGDLEVFPDEGLVRRHGEDVHLTRTEFRLLCEMAASPGRMFTREMLLERIWGYGYFGDGKIVDVHVYRLRAKIEDDAANPRHVITVRGLGYKVVA
jgi:DNA-binding response OmpR family regulator